jgi:hypothetical protein
MDVVWQRIEDAAGEEFRQIRGGRFTFAVFGNSLIPDRTDRVLARSQFERALERMPVRNTVPLQDLQGPSYLYAILMDERVRRGDW